MPVINVHNLSKKYQLGGYHSNLLSEKIPFFLRSLFRKNKNDSYQTDFFWALKNISFEIEQGEIIGVIGNNGAGKSTLLKILSRITSPTSGIVEMYGNVASLLEVGTGFHPELTGKENIFLNGAILGMNQSEIKKNFDNIVSFAEIEQFIDTPVKRYSSGMYVRLAFAVAAHLDPEILIIDEVLAVGDIEFQKKCLGKMQNVAKSGRTILFVSHNMNAIQSLCTKVIYLKNGSIVEIGEVKNVIKTYLRDSSVSEKNIWLTERQNDTSYKFIKKVSFKNAKNHTVNQVAHDELLIIEIIYKAPSHGHGYVVASRVTDFSGNILFTSWDKDYLKEKKTLQGNDYIQHCTIPSRLLKPGMYILTIIIRCQIHGIVGEVEEMDLHFEVTEQGYLQGKGRLGLIAPQIEWNIKQSSI